MCWLQPAAKFHAHALFVRLMPSALFCLASFHDIVLRPLPEIAEPVIARTFKMCQACVSPLHAGSTGREEGSRKAGRPEAECAVLDGGGLSHVFATAFTHSGHCGPCQQACCQSCQVLAQIRRDWPLSCQATGETASTCQYVREHSMCNDPCQPNPVVAVVPQPGRFPSLVMQVIPKMLCLCFTSLASKGAY